MVKHAATLSRLTQEREYEDSIVQNLFHFCLDCLEDIKDLSKKEKKLVSATLTVISEESEKHSYMFGQLIQMLWEDEEGDY